MRIPGIVASLIDGGSYPSENLLNVNLRALTLFLILLLAQTMQSVGAQTVGETCPLSADQSCCGSKCHCCIQEGDPKTSEPMAPAAATSQAPKLTEFVAAEHLVPALDVRLGFCLDWQEVPQRGSAQAVSLTVLHCSFLL